ncbi:MAG: DUF899 family protein [Pseudomonadota bacterium]
MGETTSPDNELLEQISTLEASLYEQTLKLNELKKQLKGSPVPDYQLQTLSGPVSLSGLFGTHDRLLAIHNMGQACRYCTLWADGFNGFLPHLESTLAVVLLSKDSPSQQQTFAHSRGWRFRMASHRESNYLEEQGVGGQGNYPGAVAYRKEGDQIYRLNAAAFGPGDLYCSQWNLLGLAGLTEADWTPQYRYWQRPAQLEDGGENLID